MSAGSVVHMVRIVDDNSLALTELLLPCLCGVGERLGGRVGSREDHMALRADPLFFGHVRCLTIGHVPAVASFSLLGRRAAIAPLICVEQISVHVLIVHVAF